MGSPTKRHPLGSPPKPNDANANANNPPDPSLCASQLGHHHWAAPDVQLSVSVTEGFLCLLPHSSRIHLFSVSWLAPQRAGPPFVGRFIRRRPPSSSVHARARVHARTQYARRLLRAREDGGTATPPPRPAARGGRHRRYGCVSYARNTRYVKSAASGRNGAAISISSSKPQRPPKKNPTT